MGQHFVSYARADGSDFVLRLIDEVQRPGLKLWVDRISMPLGTSSYPRDLDAAISDSDTVLFVWSRMSAKSKNCQRELLAADDFNKPIVPLRIHPDAERWFSIRGLQELDFTSGHEADFAKLRDWLAQLDSAEGRASLFRQGLEQAQEIQRRAGEADRPRADRAVAHFQRRVAEFDAAAEDPINVEHFAEERIKESIIQEQLPEQPRARRSGVHYVNELPPSGLHQFRDRADETEQLRSYLVDDVICLVVVIGRDGIGKTAVVRRLLEAQGTGLGPQIADGVVYLTAEGPRPVSAAVLLADLGQLVPAPQQTSVRVELNRPELTVTQKLDKLLRGLGPTRVLLAIDNLEELLDPETHELLEPELDEILRTLIVRHDHAVKIVLLTRTAPEPLLEPLPARIARLSLDDGLPVPDAVQFLKELDAELALGLRSTDEALLERAASLTRGHPNALEALCGILASSGLTSLPELLDEFARLPVGGVAEHLLGELYNRLDQVDKRIVQALAVYGYAVRPGAVEYLLHPYQPGHDIEAALDELRERRLVRQVDDRWRLPSPSRKRVFERIPQGSLADREQQPPPWTLFALLRRAADYFASARKLEVATIDDLSAQFTEIDLRIRAEQFDEAFEVITEVDQYHLSHWGYSQILVEQRKKLVDRLDEDYEVGNEAALGHAARRLEDYDDAADHYRRALSIAQAQGDTLSQKRLYLNLGSVSFDAGYADRAERFYQTALALAREHDLREEEATPLSGLSLCLAENGKFSAALELQQDALTIARDSQDRKLEADLLLNAGLWQGQKGERQLALDTLEQGLRLSRESGFRLLEGQFLDAMAELIVDRSLPAPAIERAAYAVQIAHELDARQLLREASYTLALALMCKDDVDQAAAAIDVAWRYRSGRRALASLLLRGVIALGQRQYQKGYDSFQLVHEEAGPLRARNERNFALLDTQALALCGLVLCGEQHWLDEAVATFRAAREITDARGVVERTLRLLDLLEVVGSFGSLAPARAAASGSSEPDRLTGPQTGSAPPISGPMSASSP
jgi:tetratricopeptide (TPR) repeat protein